MILTTKYHYDSQINQCDQFKYHGCGGNWNNFDTEEKCTARCSKLILFRRFHLFVERIIEPYRDTHHNYVDALITAKLGLGYITGVIEFILGAIFYIMCLPFVRKSGHFQVGLVIS